MSAALVDTWFLGDLLGISSFFFFELSVFLSEQLLTLELGLDLLVGGSEKEFASVQFGPPSEAVAS